MGTNVPALGGAGTAGFRHIAEILQGNRGEARRYPAPISAPAAKTNAPPRTTWNVARRNGVSMKRFWIQTMAHSSTNTTTKAITVAVQKSAIR